MLASSSDNNDVPSRNSSLSSLSEKGQFININMSDNMCSSKYFNSPNSNDIHNSYFNNNSKPRTLKPNIDCNRVYSDN